MKSYISHTSAALLLGIPNIEYILGFDLRNPIPEHVTYTTHGARSFSTRKITHVYEGILPDGAIRKHNGCFVASPELTFLELARSLNLHSLILLGLQMCSYPPGKPHTAITTKAKLQSFIAAAPGHPGRRKAGLAASLLSDGSASIMESLTYMLLTLPPVYGGYGLGGAVFNHEIELTKEHEGRRCFVDLYYKRKKVAVEYDSFAHHSTPAEQAKDMLRANALEREGLSVMHMGTVQLYNKDACESFAENLAARLGQRIRIRTSKFAAMQEQLRTLLPTQRREREIVDEEFTQGA